MKRKSIYCLGLALMAVAAASCGEDLPTTTRPVPPVPPVVELPPLEQPKDPVVSVRQARMAVVEWVGDTPATSYQVEMNGRVEELEGTSYGSRLTEETDYAWRVRAIRDSDTTAWVAGPPFRTMVYEDPRTEWVGYWNIGQWELGAEVSGMPVPLDQLWDILPQQIVTSIFDAATFKLTTPEEQGGESTGYEDLLITFDFLEEYGLPSVAAIYLEDRMFWLEEYMSTPIDFPGVPFPVADVPFLQEIQGLDAVEDLQITKLQFVMNELRLQAGPIAGEQMPFTGILGGQLAIETDNAMVNLGIGLLRPKLKLTFTSDVRRAPVTPPVEP
jgi:hypothetical protein